jgi:hypothetical protein
VSVPSTPSSRSRTLSASIAEVAARRADSGLSAWDEFWIVVGGSIAAAAILAAVRWAWRRHDRAVLSIECDNTSDFNKRVGNTDRAVAPVVEEHRPRVALAKLIRVSEIRGRSGARNVVVRIKDVSPPAPHTSAPVELKWSHSSEANDIRPSGHKSAFAELVIFYETADGRQGWRMTPTVLEHADRLEFTLEILVDGKPYSETRFRIDNAWSHARIDALHDDEWPPASIEFPKIEKA